ncbi:TraY domain-containing protein [Oceanospirillum sp.]|uniref:type II toxin-antitoxin system RelB family antitoxin n=1 Tax=Oceanospirillum sp. TaxID=2021254 RepID=UPI003A90D4CB
MATSIRLNEDIEHRLNHLAEVTGRSKAFYLRRLIEDHFDELEEIYLAEDTLQRIRRGEEKIHSLRDVEHELGLDN